MASFLRVLAFPHSEIAKRDNPGFVICDRFADLFVGGSDAIGFTPEAFNAANPTVSVDWGKMPLLKHVVNLGFIQFAPDGRAVQGTGARIDKARGGVYIQPRVAPLDLKIGDNQDDFDGGNFDQHWEAERGTWNTILPLVGAGAAEGTAILNTGADQTAIARSVGTLPANRSFLIDLEFYGLFAGPQPGFRYEWGGSWSLVIRHSQKMTIERKSVDANGQAQWVKVRTLHEFPAGNFLGGRYRITIMRLDGRLVVLVEGKNGGQQGVWYLNQEDNKVTDVSWPAAKHRVTVYNCRARCGLSLVKWSNADGTPYGGLLEREVRRKVPANGSAITSCGGWKFEGTRATVTVEEEGEFVTYTLELGANTDGISSPFLVGSSVRFVPAWSEPDASGINLRKACKSVSVSLALPPQMAGAEASIELDTDLLRTISGWENVLQRWCPIRIDMMRMGGDWTTVFDGYIYSPNSDSGNVAERSKTVTCRDNIIRLSKNGDVNHAPVDHRYPPLDILFAEKFFGGGGGYDLNGQAVDALYGGECVKELLRIALGDAYAERLNGNGNPLRYIAADHPPLIRTNSDRFGYLQLEQALSGESKTEGKPMFPAPFGDAVIDWITGPQIGGADRCIFFFRGDTPYYGRYYNLIAAGYTTVRTVRDSDVAGGITNALTGIQVESRPERDANRVYVLGPEAPELQGLLPAMRLAQKLLPDDDPRSAKRTWERTIWVREAIAQLIPEAIAEGIIGQLTNVSIEQPSFVMRGDERWFPGDIIKPVLDGPDSDDTLNLDTYYRAERIDHRWVSSEGAEAFVTTVTPRPLTAKERGLLP